jgi:hypothetical protein
MTKKFHLALSVQNLESCVLDFTQRFGCEPCVVVEGEYALWRTAFLNVSIRCDACSAAGTLRHLGWEDDSVQAFTTETDVNGVVWERFTAQQQAHEINSLWPGAGYRP